MESRSRTILVHASALTIRSDLRQALESAGFTVEATTATTVGLADIEQSGADFVLLDSVMLANAARAVEAAEARAHAFGALHQVAVAAGGVLDPIALASLAAEWARELLQIDGATVYWWDDNEGILECLTQKGPRASPPDQIIHLGEGLIGQTFLRHEPIVVENYQAWEHALPAARQGGAGTGAAVPILVADRAVGVLAVGTYGPHHYPAEHVQLLALLAAQVGPPIEAARLYAEAERRRTEAEALAEFTRQVTAQPDPDRIAHLIAEHAQRLIGADYAAVLLLRPDGRADLRAVAGSYPQDSPEGRVFSTAVGHLATILAARQPVVLEGLSASPHSEDDESPIHSILGGCTALATPLLGPAGVLGVLWLGWRENVRPTKTQVRLTEALAGYAAPILENVLTRLKMAAQAETLARSERLRALGQLAGGAAHDLNQYLALIVGYSSIAEMALQDVDPDHAQTREALRIITQAAMDGAESIKRLLTFARSRENAPSQSVDLHALLHEVADLTAPAWRDAAQAEGRPISLSVEAEQGLAIDGWPGSLREALTNLVINAVDALPHGGTIRLAARRRGDRIVVEVEDSGIGMSPEVQEHAFEPFFTSKGERGSGLGLAMVFGIVERHRGQITIDSAPSRGTNVQLSFPAASSSIPTTGTATTQKQRGVLRILAVDDEPELVQMMVRILSRRGHTVVTAPSGEAALERLAVEPFDLVISDLGMGAGMNGWELNDHIRQRYPNVGFVLATGWAETIDSEEAHRRGVQAVIAKPYLAADLERLIATLRLPPRSS